MEAFLLDNLLLEIDTINAYENLRLCKHVNYYTQKFYVVIV